MDRSEHEPLEPLSDETLRAERQLRQFQPRPVNLDRDRLMFLAGQASTAETRNDKPAANAIHKNWFWPVSTLAMSTVAACLAVALTMQMSQPPVERVIVREAVAPKPKSIAAPPVQAQSQPTPITPPRFVSAPVLALPLGSALQMRNMALQFGIDAIPTIGNSSTAPESTVTPSHWQQLRGAADGRDRRIQNRNAY